MIINSRYRLFWFLMGVAGVAEAQGNLVYDHYYMNPNLYNPSYMLSSGYSEIGLNYRRQWIGFEGAPVTATLNAAVPITDRYGVGLWAANDQAGVFTTTTGMLSFAYQVYFGKHINTAHHLAFGLSFGATDSRIDLNLADNPSDPAITNTNTSYLSGQFGIHYQYKDFRIGFSVPQIFKTYVLSEESFSKPGIEPFKNTITTASYLFHFGEQTTFQPIVLFRTSAMLPSYYEVSGTIGIDDVAWVGGGYREHYGALAMIGFMIREQWQLGYAYEFAPQQSTTAGTGTHELQLEFRFGKRKTHALAELQEQSFEATPATSPSIHLELPPQKAVTEKGQINADTTSQHKARVQSETEQPVAGEPNVVPNPDIRSDIILPQPGYYTVVGVFSSLMHAVNYSDAIRRAGFASTVSRYPRNDYYFVHVGRSDSLQNAAGLTQEFRARKGFAFSEAWILHIK